MSTLNLPEPIAAYFAAEHHPAALVHCFTPHAVMNDFGHRYVGIDAIKAFLAEASAKYGATSEPIAIEREDGCQLVRTRVTGNFPGSPTVLSYRFHLERGLIATLEITA